MQASLAAVEFRLSDEEMASLNELSDGQQVRE